MQDVLVQPMCVSTTPGRKAVNMNDDERDFAEEQWNEDNLLRPTQFYWTAMRGNGTSHVECVNSRTFDDRKECYTNMVKFLDASKHGDWEYGVKELHQL